MNKIVNDFMNDSNRLKSAYAHTLILTTMHLVTLKTALVPDFGRTNKYLHMNKMTAKISTDHMYIQI